MLVSDSLHWLTDPLTDSRLVNLMALNDTNCLMMSQQLVKVFLRRKKLCKMVGTLLNQKFLRAGQMLISLPTHATEIRIIDWAQNLLYLIFMVKICVWTCNMTLARWTQPSGPLCLWQCLSFCLPFERKSWWIVLPKANPLGDKRQCKPITLRPWQSYRYRGTIPAQKKRNSIPSLSPALGKEN